MPNWCNNSIVISGPYDVLFEVAKLCHTKENDFDFNGILPNPLCKSLKNYIDWNIQNWGTKWIFEDPQVELFTDNISIYALSAWSPPIEFFKHLVKKYPFLTVEMVYAEIGLDFAGKVKINKEEFIEEEFCGKEKEDCFREFGLLIEDNDLI
jgi:hypothetical protein